MHKKLFSTLASVALLMGMLTLAAPVANAAAPFDTQNFLPTDDVDDVAGTGEVLSDRFDGVDAVAHLTNVSTADAERVKWFACSVAATATTATVSQAALAANCTTTIGEDTTPRVPPGGSPFAPIDEAYDVNWDIPGTLDGSTRDILAISCIGAGDDIEGADRNCAQDVEENVFLEDGQTGALATQTTSGEMSTYCTSDVDGGPNSGIADPCERAVLTTPEPLVDARFEAFPHGSSVPNDGFVMRVFTSDDVTDAEAFLDDGTDAQTDYSGFDTDNTCALLQSGTNFNQWECVFTAGDVTDNAEAAVYISNGASAVGSGDCTGAECVLDSHYIVSSARTPTAAVESFTATTTTPPPTAGCQETNTPDKDETNTVSATGNPEGVEGCLNDQFGDNLGINSPVTFETATTATTTATVQQSFGFTSCSGSTATGTGAAPRLHDHNGDGRFEHCHTTTDAAGRATATIDNFTDFTQTAKPGDQVVTFCTDPQFSATALPAAQPVGHGCADTTVKDTITKHWISLPEHVHLVFAVGGAIDVANPCHSGDQFRENVQGDTDTLLACTMDGAENPATTAQTRGGRLQWFIEPTQGAQPTATRFVGSPPSETGADGRATATIEAFRAGNDFINVGLNSDTGNEVDADFVQKRVTEGQPLPGRNHARKVRFHFGHSGGRLAVAGRVTVNDGFNKCRKRVPVKVQRRGNGRWLAKKQARTNRQGKFRFKLRDRTGRYRVVAPRTTKGQQVCRWARKVKRHRH